MMFQLIPGIAIPAMTFMFTPKYTHSRYWLCATGMKFLLFLLISSSSSFVFILPYNKLKETHLVPFHVSEL